MYWPSFVAEAIGLSAIVAMCAGFCIFVEDGVVRHYSANFERIFLRAKKIERIMRREFTQRLRVDYVDANTSQLVCYFVLVVATAVFVNLFGRRAADRNVTRSKGHHVMSMCLCFR